MALRKSPLMEIVPIFFKIQKILNCEFVSLEFDLSNWRFMNKSASCFEVTILPYSSLIECCWPMSGELAGIEEITRQDLEMTKNNKQRKYFTIRYSSFF